MPKLLYVKMHACYINRSVSEWQICKRKILVKYFCPTTTNSNSECFVRCDVTERMQYFIRAMYPVLLLALWHRFDLLLSFYLVAAFKNVLGFTAQLPKLDFAS